MSSGVIEFPFSENEWAYRWFEEAQAKKPTSRITINPRRVPLSMKMPTDYNQAQQTWCVRARIMIDTADQVYLRAGDKCFRFEKAISDVSKTMEVITIGAQELNNYAKKHWSRLNYFFAERYDGYNFNIRKMLTNRKGEGGEHPVELITRVRNEPGELDCHLSFLATGSGASNEIIKWRNTVELGETGRFAEDDSHVNCRISVAKHPLTFLHENRKEFNNHSYEFEGDRLMNHIAKIVQLHEDLADSGTDSI